MCSQCGAVQREIDLSICDKDPQHVPAVCALQDPQLGAIPAFGSHPDAPIRAESETAQWAALERAHGRGGWSRIGSEEVVRGDQRLERVQCMLADGRQAVTYFSSDPTVGMVPDGPYRSKWTSGDYYLISAVKSGETIYAVVRNGQQAREGVEFEKIRDARTYLRDNGFEKRSKDPKLGGIPMNDFDPYSRAEIQVGGYRIKMTGDVLRRGGAPVPMSFDDSVAAAVALGAIPPTRALSAAALAAAKAAGTSVVMPVVPSPDGAHAAGTSVGDKQVAAFVAAYPKALPADSTTVRYGGHKDMILDPSGQPNKQTGKSELRESGPGSMVLYGGLKADGSIWQSGIKSDHDKNWKDYSQPQQFFFRDALGPNGEHVDLLAVVAQGGPLGGPLPAWLVTRLGGLGSGAPPGGTPPGGPVAASGGPGAGMWG